MSQIIPAIKGLLLGGIISIPILLICISEAGAGHGTYFLAKLFFPVTMLLTAMFGSIEAPFAIIAAIQYPLLGAFLYVAKVKGKFKQFTLSIGIVHAILSILAVVFSNFP